jgi:hypothetical protein
VLALRHVPQRLAVEAYSALSARYSRPRAGLSGAGRQAYHVRGTGFSVESFADVSFRLTGLAGVDPGEEPVWDAGT